MAKRHHTIILIPHAHAKLRKWQVTSLQVGTAAGALLLLTLVASLFAWLHFSRNVNPIEIARLKLPMFLRIVEALLKTLALLGLRDVQHELHDDGAVFDANFGK